MTMSNTVTAKTCGRHVLALSPGERYKFLNHDSQRSREENKHVGTSVSEDK